MMLAQQLNSNYSTVHHYPQQLEKVPKLGKWVPRA